jgi:hypothetical protein
MSTLCDSEAEALVETELDYFKNNYYYIEKVNDKYRAVFYSKDDTYMDNLRDRIKGVFSCSHT